MKNTNWTLMIRCAGVLLVLSTAMLGGCNKANKGQAALLEQENIELRAKARQLESALNTSEQDRAVMQGEVRALRSENDRLRADAARAPSNTLTGFEGIAGVSASMSPTGEVILDVAGDVLFDSGQVTLKQASKKSLDSIVQVLNSQYPGRLIRIGGHTDSDPIRRSQWKTNQRLGSERALAVEEYLASKGVTNKRMYTASFGPNFPRGNKSQSRRVEIVVLASDAP